MRTVLALAVGGALSPLLAAQSAPFPATPATPPTPSSAAVAPLPPAAPVAPATMPQEYAVAKSYSTYSSGAEERNDVLLQAAETAAAVLELASAGRADEARAMALEAAALLNRYAGHDRMDYFYGGAASAPVAVEALPDLGYVGQPCQPETVALAPLAALGYAGQTCTPAPGACASDAPTCGGPCAAAPGCSSNLPGAGGGAGCSSGQMAEMVAPFSAPSTVDSCTPFASDAAVARVFEPSSAGVAFGSAPPLDTRVVQQRNYASREEELLSLLAAMEAEVRALRHELTYLRARMNGGER